MQQQNSGLWKTLQIKCQEKKVMDNGKITDEERLKTHIKHNIKKNKAKLESRDIHFSNEI